jgi:Kdo2-lipid IVA lauroyltransferase/acyltransferase
MKQIKYITELLAIIILPVFFIIPYRLRIKIGGYMGLIIYYLYKRRRDIAFENICGSFPDLSTDRHNELCRNSFRHFGISITEFIQLIRFSDKFMDKYISIEGEGYIKEALAKGNGIIGISPHMGNWEFIAAYVASKGYPLSVIMKRQSNPYVNNLIAGLRRSFSMQLIYKSSAGFSALKALKQNRIVAFVADQDAGKNGIFIDFLGRPASTAQGPARFAVACKSPVMIFIGVREKNGKLKIIITPELEFDYIKKNSHENIYNNTKKWSEKIEESIKKYPEQYFWMHRRWKTKEKKQGVSS